MRIAVIEGDGIGAEVTAEALKVLDATGACADVEYFDFGGERYLRTGETLPDSAVDELRSFDAVLLGAVGHPDVAPGVLERGILLKLRFELDLAVNLRPVKLLDGVTSALAGRTAADIDFVVVRENTEGLYAGAGGAIRVGTPNEIATQTSINTRLAAERCIRYAFDLATESNSSEVMLVHKTNVLADAGGLWQRAFDDVAADYPSIDPSYGHVDAVCLWMVTQPQRFQVLVTDNLFGDIITDLGAAISGGLGYAASGNLNLNGDVPSVYEPVHGSAPDIVGTGRANPVAAILSLWLALRGAGEGGAASRVLAATEQIVAEVGAEIGRGLATSDVGDRIAAAVEAQ